MLIYCGFGEGCSGTRNRPTSFHRAALTLVPFLLLCLGVVPASARQGREVGKLRTVRQVLVTHGSTMAGATADFFPARDMQGVEAGQGLRTLKRAQAEVDFRDGSVLRVNERSDLVIEDTPGLRNIHLGGGVVWVHVAKGVPTQVETPSATAVARGTVFTVEYRADGTTVLVVLEGTVEIAVGGKTVSVAAGQMITVATGGTPPAYTVPDAPVAIPPTLLPVPYGGGADAWWADLPNNLGIAVTTGTSVLLDLRTSTLGESLQELTQAPPPGGGSTVPSFFLSDPVQRQLLFHAAQSTVSADVQNSGLTPTAYAALHGSETLTAAGFTAAQITTLQTLGINNVGDAVAALSVNGANLTVSLPTGREAYVLSQIHGLPNRDYRLLDQNDSSLAFVGVGAALALLTDAKQLHFPMPTLSGEAFGFLNDPEVVGQRARIDGYISQRTHYILEGNIIQVVTGKVRTSSKADSVFVVEQAVSDRLTVFAGRRRFYEGPIFQDDVLSQLVADRYTGAGVTYRAAGVKFDGAYLYDANPSVRGAQHGSLGSASTKVGLGVFGLNYLHVPGVGDGNGVTFHGSYPVVPATLELYGEAGRGPDKANLQSYGAYFPGIYQKTDVDFFVEYGRHEGLGHALSFIANRSIKKALDLRAYVSFHGHADTRAGLAAIVKFSTR